MHPTIRSVGIAGTVVSPAFTPHWRESYFFFGKYFFSIEATTT